MPEPLTSQLLGELLAQLHAAFPRNLGGQNPAMMADVYRNGLRGLSGDSVREAVSRCIQLDQYFPKVSRLREIAREYDRQRTVEIRHRENEWGVCHICGARVEMLPFFWETGEKDARGNKLFVRAGEREHIIHKRGPHGLRDDEQERFA